MKKVLCESRLLFTWVVLFIMSLPSVAQESKQSFDRTAFYDAISNDNIAEIDQQLAALEKENFAGKQAFEGTLQMKKAGLLKGAGKKLNMFKQGHKKLEAIIGRDSMNAEYRFLRLVIQENSPGILGYKNDMQRDGAVVKKYYKNLPPAVQKAVARYSKKSKVLQSQDF